jgi:hypothetical protein
MWNLNFHYPLEDSKIIGLIIKQMNKARNLFLKICFNIILPFMYVTSK